LPSAKRWTRSRPCRPAPENGFGKWWRRCSGQRRHARGALAMGRPLWNRSRAHTRNRPP
jgi:hypothetical protein